MLAQTFFDDFEDLTGTFSGADIVASLVLAFVLCALVGLVYQRTHRGISYSQSYVQTLVLMGMLTSLVMLVIGSNIARAFSLVGALSIVRFRNAVKETRDVGFIFFAMAIGMATGTRFYVLAAVATVAIGGVVMIMHRFEWYRLDVASQVVKVQVPPDEDYTERIEDVLRHFSTDAQLVSLETIRGGALNELTYSTRLKTDVAPSELIRRLQALTDGQKVTILTGFDNADL